MPPTGKGADLTKIAQNTLVVVADGHQARLFRTSGVGDDLSLSSAGDLSPRQLSDDGPSGSRPEDQTPRQTDEATFAKQLAAKLNRMHEAGDFKALVLVADPQTLGQLRDAMDSNLAASIALTLDKELVNHSVADILKIVRKAAA